MNGFGPAGPAFGAGQLADGRRSLITGKAPEEDGRWRRSRRSVSGNIESSLKGPVLRRVVGRALGKSANARKLVGLQRQLRGDRADGRYGGASKAHART